MSLLVGFKSMCNVNTVEPPMTVTSLQLLFIPGDSPYIESCLNLFTAATTLQRHKAMWMIFFAILKPLICSIHCSHTIYTFLLALNPLKTV